MTKGIYSFFYDCGRMGSLGGVFVATSQEVLDINGKDVYFGEVLGKHSDIEVRIDSGNIVLKSDNPEFVEMFEQLGLATGFDPVYYYFDVNDNERDISDEEEDED